MKICGITRWEDASAAVEAGADALGFMFFKGSSRRVSTVRAAEIIRRLPERVAKVGVFANALEEEVWAALDECALTMLQFHGEEPPEFCRRFRLEVIKAFRVQDESSLSLMPPYRHEIWLLDSFVPGRLGGTGARFNWDLARRAVQLNPNLLLAGGLTPDNVSEAVRKARPLGVDVSSGVESAPGRKDPIKMKEFVAAAKAALAE